MLTAKKLARFCEIRNASQCNSNLQFELDAREAGFEVDELGKPERIGPETNSPRNPSGYQWITSVGTLTERGGIMSFEPATIINVGI